jgi:hypothetical protein
MTDVSDDVLNAEVVLQEVADGDRWLVRRDVREAAAVILYEFDGVRGRLDRLEEERAKALSCMENAVAAMRVEAAARKAAVEQAACSVQELATVREQLAKAVDDNKTLCDELSSLNEAYSRLIVNRNDIVESHDRRSALLSTINSQINKEFAS